jgi:hypothetical protein
MGAPTHSPKASRERDGPESSHRVRGQDKARCGCHPVDGACQRGADVVGLRVHNRKVRCTQIDALGRKNIARDT